MFYDSSGSSHMMSSTLASELQNTNSVVLHLIKKKEVTGLRPEVQKKNVFVQRIKERKPNSKSVVVF